MNTNTIEQKEHKLNVKDLRRAGYKVTINHLRRVKGERGVLVNKYEVERDQIDPKGGATEAHITSPSGSEGRGTANCYYKDSYCRKEGIHYAIERALENLNEVK